MRPGPTALAMWVALTALLGGCGDSGSELIVELRTDYIAFEEARSARTRLLRDSETVAFRSVETGIFEGDLTLGQRIAEIAELENGTYRVEVELVGAGGSSLGARRARVDVQGATGLTVVLTRDCAGVSCPAAGGSPAALACLGGECVAPECTPENPAACPPSECSGDTDCAAGSVACTEGACLGGVCALRGVDSLCGGSEYCNPAQGCRLRSTGADAGAVDANVPPIPADSAYRVAAGNEHGCAARNDGVWCWGGNRFGQVGNGIVLDQPIPVPIPEAAGTVALSAGGSTSDGDSSGQHTCALRSDGELLCWGYNDRGQLGDGTEVDRLQPTPVPGLPTITNVSVGAKHVCAVAASGDVHCWGDNQETQLGRATTVSSDSSPGLVAGLPGSAVRVDAGSAHNCAILSTGELACWGGNEDGELGDGTRTNSMTPLVVPGLSAVRDVSAGALCTCAIDGAGTVNCWGRNQFGQLGRNGTSPQELVPGPVTGLPAPALLVSVEHVQSCAVLSGGAVWCWGETDHALGPDRPATDGIPVAVVGAPAAISIDVGDHFVCAFAMDESVWCWGDNGDWQLGDGTDRSRPDPVALNIGL